MKGRVAWQRSSVRLDARYRFSSFGARNPRRYSHVVDRQCARYAAKRARYAVKRVRGGLPGQETARIVEEAGPPGPPLPPEEVLARKRELWPWMLVLLVLVLGGLAAAYFATRDDKKNAKGVTVTTTLAQTVRARTDADADDDYAEGDA
jgi:hypothetical protein